MGKFKLDEFKESNCALYTPRKMFLAIFNHSNGNPCDGCSYVSTCDNYYRLHPDKTKPKPVFVKHEKPNRKKGKNKNKPAF